MTVIKRGTGVAIDFREYSLIGAMAVALSNAAKQVDYLEGYMSDRWDAIEAADPQSKHALASVLCQMHSTIYRLLLNTDHRTSCDPTKAGQKKSIAIQDGSDVQHEGE